MDWQLIIGEPHGLSTGLVIAVGLLVGWGSTRSGLGAGLALPVLAAAGLPLPAALLGVKLPMAVADLAATLSACRQQETALRHTLLTPACLLAAAAGAGSAAAVVAVPATWVAAAALPLAALAWLLRGAAARGGGIQPCQLALSWGAYIGLCGVGAGLLWRWGHGPGTAETKVCPVQSGLAWRAAANGGALLVLLAAGQQATTALATLAAAQAVGAYLAMRSSRPTRPWRFRRPASRRCTATRPS